MQFQIFVIIYFIVIFFCIFQRRKRCCTIEMFWAECGRISRFGSVQGGPAKAIKLERFERVYLYYDLGHICVMSIIFIIFSSFYSSNNILVINSKIIQWIWLFINKYWWTYKWLLMNISKKKSAFCHVFLQILSRFCKTNLIKEFYRFYEKLLCFINFTLIMTFWNTYIKTFI